MENFEVKLVTDLPEKDQFLGARLGISEERFEELAPIMYEKTINSPTLLNAIANMSKDAKTLNELVFMVLGTVDYLHSIKNRNPFLEILSDVRSKSGPSSATGSLDGTLVN